MEPRHIERSLYKQDFQVWEEVEAELASKGLGYFLSFFDEEDRVELTQIYRLSGMIDYIAWDEAQKQRENSQA
jgi:hypothetical protein